MMINLLKMIFRRSIKLAVAFVVLVIHQRCAPFERLPQNVSSSSKIIGVFTNDCDSTNAWYKRHLWQCFDFKHDIDRDSLFVRFELTSDNKFRAKLLNDTSVLREKLIKGKFKEDNCFYTRRIFYFIPILPILWGYSNSQERFYRADSCLIFESTYNSGGVAIIMAGGDKGDKKWIYHKVLK